MNRKQDKLTYAEALKAADRARVRIIVPVINEQPELRVDRITQTKLATIIATMETIGTVPGDVPANEFDEPITYNRLPEKSRQWLNRYGIPVDRERAPLGSRAYAWIFGSSERLPVSQENEGRFFSRLIHCLLLETQILVARQYFHGLGLYKANTSISLLSEVFPSDLRQDLLLSTLHKVEFDQLHGRIFLEYCAVMMRAQWDKLTRLFCLVLDLSWNWNSVTDGLKAIEDRFEKEQGHFHRWCSYHGHIFIGIANERLAESGWLKQFRDPLLHDVGQHSVGVVPNPRNLETTSEMWDRVREEHNWLREAMMAMLISFISKNTNPSPKDS